MKNENMVSVIIPTYNRAHCITDAVESVLNQTYKNYEIIVVDDGSTDGTQNLLNLYLSKIKYIYQKNSGVSSARNKGIREAKGEYIAFLDSDDYWEPYKLELQVNCIEYLKDIDLIYTNFSIFDDNGNHSASNLKSFKRLFGVDHNPDAIFHKSIVIKDILNVNIPSLNGSIMESRIYFGNIFKKIVLGNFIPTPTVLIKSNALGPSEMFNEFFSTAEDTDFFLRFCKRHKVAFIDVYTTRCKRGGNDHLSKNTPIMIENTIKTIKNMIEGDNSLYSENKGLIKKRLGDLYYKLSYHYLSEFNKAAARKNAIISIKNYWMQFGAFVCLFGVFLPDIILKRIGSLKRFFRHV